MVKFCEQLEGEMVPEWKEAFVDYGQLKERLKKIRRLLNTSSNGNTTIARQQKNNISSTTSFLISFVRRNFSSFGHQQQHRDHGLIQVHKKLEFSAGKGSLFETELLDKFEDFEGANEFFACLDHQLNKVNQFYTTKEREFYERGNSLKKQTEILIELKTTIFKQKQGTGLPSHEYNDEDSISSDFTRESKEDDSITSTISCVATDEESTRGRAHHEQGNHNTIEEFEQINADPFVDIERSMRMNEDGKMRTPSVRGFNCQGKYMRIEVPTTNPTQTFSVLWDDLVNQSSRKCGPERSGLHINKPKLRHAEKMIKGALIELYKGLGYLQTYRYLNMLAFVKILKKFDKVTSKQVLTIYLKVVESSYFNSSDKVTKLADEVEEIFVKHFAEDNRRKAMKYLKPTQRKESHKVTFFIGLFTGCFIAFFTAYIIMAHIAGMYRPKYDTVYMETVYPMLSMFSLLVLHLFMYGCNIFMWRKARINYSFIFELAPTKELTYRDVFLICTTSMTCVMGVLSVHLFLATKGYSSAQVQSIPGLLLLVFLVLLVCPLDIFYKSSRYRFLSSIRNILLSPLYKVVMLDFFMADQLCSEVPMLRDLEYIACYYITGSYKARDYGYCTRTKSYRDLAYAISFLPYYWRAMQCARRFFDENQRSHLANMGKYISAMLAAGAKLAYEKERSMDWLCMFVVMSSTSTVYQLYWDYVEDWGLLQLRSKNPWLRDELMLRRKSIYFFSMGLNLILRLAWVQSVLHSNFGCLDNRITDLSLAVLEVIRRGQWNFYRVENEHLNNAGNFRAVKTVPLPFHEVYEQ